MSATSMHAVSGAALSRLWRAALLALPLGMGAPAVLAASAPPAPATSNAGPVEITDGNGNVIKLPKPATRMVSLSPHVTEMVYVAGAGERLVGVTKYSDYPPEAQKLPVIGSLNAVDLDRLLALNADLVLVWFHGAHMKQMDKIRSLSMPVFFSNPVTLDQVAADVERIGVLAGTQRVAAAWAEAFRKRQQAMAQKYSSRPPVRVFYQFWNRPLSTLNRDHVVTQLISLCGGVNVFAQTPSVAPVVNVEAVIAANPQAIIVGSVDNRHKEWADAWKSWRDIEAVRLGNVFSVDSNLQIRSGPRVLDGAQVICDALEASRTRMAAKP